jgi:hypothetical protein
MTDRTADDSQRAYARFAGFMYLVVLVFDVAGLLIVSGIAGHGSVVDTAHRIMASELLYRVGLGCSLVGSLSTILLAIGLYVAVKPVDGNLAMTALLFRVAEAVTGAFGVIIGFAVLHTYLAANHANAFDANQLGALADLFPEGTQVAAIFFSLGSTLFFYLFLKSNYIPKIISVWGIFASLVYTTYWFVSLILPQDASGTITALSSLPILIAELSTGFWLLIAGIKVRQ